jgi:hypothetical protein
MEPLTTQPSLRDRIAPWVEGGALAILVLVVVSLGGEAVLTSYHGYLHSAIGEAVLRDGLLPENPYHAGSDLQYYLLYPLLGVLLGRLGGGPLWGFAILNIFAAALMGPALDALSKRFGLDFRARRFAFAAMVLGFNGLGWVYMMTAGGEPLPEGAMPLVALLDSTRPFDSMHWDGRLQSFLPKFLNVSSFALSLPFGLFAISENLREGRTALWRCAALLGVTTAVNPLVGLFVGLLVLVQKLPRLREGVTALKELLPAALLALGIAVPFLLPVLLASVQRDPNAASPQLPFEGVAWANLLGPLFFLLLGAAFALGSMRQNRTHLLIAIGIVAAFSFSSLPWGNEYKFPRIAGILLAIPVGHLLGGWSKRLPGGLIAGALLLLCLPMTWQTVKVYSAWGNGATYLLDHVEDGRLAVRESARLKGWPKAVELAEKNLPSNAVLMIHPRHPDVGGGKMGAQGNQLAPLLHHSLLVDSPQIHNSDLIDLRARLDACVGFWESRRWHSNGRKETAAYSSKEALAAARGFNPTRPLALITLDLTDMPEPAYQLKAAGGTLLASENGVAMWLLPPLEAEVGN